MTAAQPLMQHPGFFERAGPFTLERIAAICNVTLAPGAAATLTVIDVRPLSDAGAGQANPGLDARTDCHQTPDGTGGAQDAGQRRHE